MDGVGVCLITDVFTHSSPQSSCFTLTGSDLVATGSCSYSNCGNLGRIETFLSLFAFDAFLQTFLTLGGTFSFSGLFRLPYNIHTRYLDHECLVDNNVCGIKKTCKSSLFMPTCRHFSNLQAEQDLDVSETSQSPVPVLNTTCVDIV